MAMLLAGSTGVQADPPRVLHTTFENYAQQQQQHDAQLLAKPEISAAPSNEKTSKVVQSKKSKTHQKSMVIINLNRASEAELASGLSGVGPAKARAIVEYRQQHGKFKTIEDLLQVRGVGPATLSKNRDRLRID
ncbi:ComEA family DNA-binding protein [Alkanindiges sp. WGS2144]|uniref:ComEA family DNA-binding protein n=1 Tax=Alkanindiges sp. WGS2144 TaxID=3366808 RepID=UPI0037504DF5